MNLAQNMKRPKYLLFQQVLEWCNKIRAERGKLPLNELPKGFKADGYSCPCGLATGVFVGCFGWGETQEEYNSSRSKSIPSSVREFVPRFDMGEFPELEI